MSDNSVETSTRTKRKTAASDTPAPETKKAAVVPQIVKVDMGDSSDEEQQQQAQQQTPQEEQSVVPRAVPTSGSEKRVATKLDWQVINNREILKRLLLPPNNVSQKGTAYLTVDKAYYESLPGGEPVDLGKFSHLKIETPYLSNLFGISSKVTQGNWAHSINFDINDSQADKLVPRFAQFLALLDSVCLEITIDLVKVCALFQKDFVKYCVGADGQVDMKKLGDMVASNFNPSLRVSKKTKEDKTVSDKVIERVDDNKFRIPTVFYFKTKIYSKRDKDGKPINDGKLIDVVCYNSNNDRVYWTSETAAFKIKDKDTEEIKPVLAHPRATYVKAQVELTAINYVQKEWYMAQVVTKLKYKNRSQVEYTASETDNVADFDDQDGVVYATDADIERVKRQEENAGAVNTNLDAEDD